MSNVIIIQARINSERLYGKVLMPLCDHPMLYYIVRRASAAKKADKVIVATSTNDHDDPIVDFCKTYNIDIYRGNEDNVLSRFYFCAKENKADNIVRLTGDNPFVDPVIIDRALDCFQEMKVDYLHYRKGLPLGMAVETFSFSALEKAYYETDDKECLEHVTLYLYKNPQEFKICNKDYNGEDYSNMRLTVDTEKDFELAEKIYSAFPNNELFGLDDIIKVYAKHPDWGGINKDVKQKKTRYKEQYTRNKDVNEAAN